MDKKKTFFRDGLGVPLILLVLAVVSAVSYLLPYAKYYYKKTTYTLNAFDFFGGKSIVGGDVVIPAQRIFTLGIIALVIIVAAVLLYKVVSPKIFGLATVLGGIIQVVSPIVLMYSLNALMKGAKQSGIMFGAYVTLLLGVLIIAYGASVLYRHKVVSLLDFMVIPGLAYLIINNYLPMSGVIIAFKDLDLSVGIFQSPWAGFDNFKFLFQSSDAYYIIRNTLCYNIAFIVLGNCFGILVGIFLSEAANKALMRTSQTLILLPQLISWVIVAYMVYGFLATDTGWINKALLPVLGYDGPNIAFYGTRKYWPYILTVLSIWKGLGYNSIIYLSSIVGIDRNLYEAAYIDGCGKVRQVFKITLPMLKPTIITLFIMAVGRIMHSDFGLFYQATQNSGALYRVTQTLDVYVYRAIMETQNLGMGSAAAAFQSVFGFFLIMSANALVRKLDASNALF